MADAGDTRAVVGRLEEGSPQEQVAAAAELLALAKRDRLRCALAGALPVASAVYQTADSGTSLEATTMELLNALLYVRAPVGGAGDRWAPAAKRRAAAGRWQHQRLSLRGLTCVTAMLRDTLIDPVTRPFRFSSAG